MEKHWQPPALTLRVPVDTPMGSISKFYIVLFLSFGIQKFFRVRGIQIHLKFLVDKSAHLPGEIMTILHRPEG